MNYCTYRDVFTGKYDCPYATVVNNSAVCTSKECKNSSDYYRRYYLLGDIPKPTIPVDWDPNLADEDYPF